MTVKIIDIHHAKDVRDLSLTYAAGYRGIIHKASEGNWFRDPSMMTRCEIAWDIGFVLGAYHFFRSNVPGQEQAYYFLKSIESLRKLTDDRLMPPWCDVETVDFTGAKVRERELLQFLRLVKMEFKRPGVYSSPGFWASNTNHPTWINLYWQWVAQWTPASTYTLPIGWTEIRSRVWQYGIAGVHSWCPAIVPGIRRAVDQNKFPGTLEELKTLSGYDDYSASPSASSSCAPNKTKIMEVLDLMLKANIDLEKAIELTRKIIGD